MDDLNGKIETCQVGSLKGLSTTFCLLDMFHTWLSHLDTEKRTSIFVSAFWTSLKPTTASVILF